SSPSAWPGQQQLLGAELRHWARLAHLQLLSSSRQLVAQLAPLLGPGEQLGQIFECRISRQVPPPPAAMATIVASATAGVGGASAAGVTAPAVAPSLARAAAAAAAGQLQTAVDVIDYVIAR
ncbi:hypothetical protein Agub_g13795, partial [Astrephomene gubernaculifera]